MTRFTPLLTLLAAVLLAAIPQLAVAQAVTYTWLPDDTNAPANWNDMANWDDAGGDFVPDGSADENAQITNGGTAFVQDVFDNFFLNGPGDIFLSNGSVLEVRSGAMMSTNSLGANVNGEVEVGTGASLRFLGSGALAAELLTMGTGGIFDYRVTSASSFGTAPATIAGTAQLGGTLQVDFGAGASFGTGDAVRLIDAGEILGEFDEIGVTGNASGSFGMGQQIGLQRIAGGNGTIAQLVVEQLLVLNVNRDTMEMSISNPDSTPIAIDGYTVASAGGAIDDGSFTGLGAGWSTSPTSPNRVTQLRTDGTTAFSNGAPSSIGLIFDPPSPTEFGVPVGSDIEFSYTLESEQEVTGFVNYVGDLRENNLVLTIDDDGMATIQNESTLTVAIEGYTVASAGGLLDASGWNSLDEQNAEGGQWAASPISDEFRVTELMNDGTTTFTPLKGFSLGNFYDDTGAGSVEDLTFEYLIAGEEDPFTGVVVFGDLPDLSPSLDGDFNGDGFVNAADYVHWRDQLGDQASYNTWRSNFGGMAGSGTTSAAPVPEPSGFVLLALLGMWPVNCLARKHFKG